MSGVRVIQRESQYGKFWKICHVRVDSRESHHGKKSTTMQCTGTLSWCTVPKMYYVTFHIKNSYCFCPNPTHIHHRHPRTYTGWRCTVPVHFRPKTVINLFTATDHLEGRQKRLLPFGSKIRHPQVVNLEARSHSRVISDHTARDGKFQAVTVG